MAKQCPSCSAALESEDKRSSAWVPILTAVGVSAAAYFVFLKVRKAHGVEHMVENALETCARAAKKLDRRMDEVALKLVG